MIVDANILLYAADQSSPHHERSARWLSEALNGDRRVGLPWASLGAFLRIATHPRVTTRPLSTDAAQAHVNACVRQPSGPLSPFTLAKRFASGTRTLSKNKAEVTEARSDILRCTT